MIVQEVMIVQDTIKCAPARVFHLGLPFPPVTPGSPEGGHPAFSAHTCPRDDGDVFRFGENLAKLCQICKV